MKHVAFSKLSIAFALLFSLWGSAAYANDYDDVLPDWGTPVAVVSIAVLVLSVRLTPRNTASGASRA